MRLILDTANLADIRYFNDYFPICGVTTNPTILSREGGDVVSHLVKIREMIGADKELHVQVTETEYERMEAEAEAIVSLLGKNTFVKIPATPDGMRATRELSARGFGITVTAVLSASQAMLAAEAGAAYVAPYVSRLENIGADGVGCVRDMASILAASGRKTEILAASFKTAREVLDCALVGAQVATVSSDVMKNLLRHTTTDTSVAGFAADWKGAFGDSTLLELIKNR